MNKPVKLKISPNHLTLRSHEKSSLLEANFSAVPIGFTILTLGGTLITHTPEPFDGHGQLEVVFLDEPLGNGANGYLTEVEGFGVSIAIACSNTVMKAITDNFNNMWDVELNLDVDDLEIQTNNFRMTKMQYVISSWKLNIPSETA